MIEKLLLGTNNSKKVEHIKQFFGDVPFTFVTPKEIGIMQEPEENGATLEDNALIKAKYYFEQSGGVPTLADDGGFEIPALNNFPGPHSKRFAGHEMSEEEVITAIIERMEDLKDSNRAARFRLCMVLMLSSSDVYVETGEISGHVPEKPYDKRMAKFPYRSLLFVDQLNKWFYDVTEEEENQLGYRKAVIEKLKSIILNS